MRTSLTLIALLAVIASASADSLRETIQAMDKKVSAAMIKKDMPTIRKLISASVTPDFKYFEDEAPGKPQSLEEMLKNMGMGLAVMKKVTKAQAKLLDLKESGSTATSKTQHLMAGTMSPDGKKVHTMSYVGISTEVYKKVGGKWKMASMTFHSDKMLIDGKPFDPAKAGGH